MKLAIGVRSSGARRSLDSRIVDVQMADHKLMLSGVMVALSASGFGLAMVKNVCSNRMARKKLAGVYSVVVATRLGLAESCRGPVMCGAAP